MESIEGFVHEGLPHRIVFDTDSKARVAEELARMGHGRVVVLSTPGQQAEAAELHDYLGGLSAGTFSEAVMHTPVAVTELALTVVDELAADCLVAVGGGSTIGLSKAIAARTGIDQIVLPTTYAGSEVTPIIGETADGRKTTRRSLDVLPEVVIYDVNLTLTLPVDVSVTSGFNAMAHAMEAMWAKEPNPIITVMAREAIRSLVEGLPEVVLDPTWRRPRAVVQQGAWLAAMCLGAVGMALHHKLCHVFGGTFNLPHAETHTVVMPYVLAYNSAYAPAVVSEFERAVGAPAAASLRKFQRSLGTPSSLAELGMPEDGITVAVEQCMQSPYWNPRPVDSSSLAELVRDAWSGAEPDAGGYRR